MHITTGEEQGVSAYQNRTPLLLPSFKLFPLTLVDLHRKIPVQKDRREKKLENRFIIGHSKNTTCNRALLSSSNMVDEQAQTQPIFLDLLGLANSLMKEAKSNNRYCSTVGILCNYSDDIELHNT